MGFIMSWFESRFIYLKHIYGMKKKLCEFEGWHILQYFFSEYALKINNYFQNQNLLKPQQSSSLCLIGCTFFGGRKQIIMWFSSYLDIDRGK